MKSEKWLVSVEAVYIARELFILIIIIMEEGGYILVGDLGGTQVRLRVYNTSSEVVYSEDTLTKDSTSLVVTLGCFLERFKESKGLTEGHCIARAVFGIAGPVEEGGVVPILVDIS